MARSTQIEVTHAAVVSTTSSPAMSPRYSHITTDEVVTALREAGWEYHSGSARLTRRPERAAYAAHVVRFRNDSLPTLRDGEIHAVVINSHDGSTAFELGIGVYRMACANGMVVRSSCIGAVRLIHHGLTIGRVLEASRRVIAAAPQAAEVVERWRGRRLTYAEQTGLAHRLAQVRWQDRLRSIVDVDDWISPQRSQDSGDDLWTSFNRIQERIIRGGSRINLTSRPGEESRVVRASRVRGAIRQVRLNEEMWQIAEEFAT